MTTAALYTRTQQPEVWTECTKGQIEHIALTKSDSWETIHRQAKLNLQLPTVTGSSNINPSSGAHGRIFEKTIPLRWATPAPAIGHRRQPSRRLPQPAIAF